MSEKKDKPRLITFKNEDPKGKTQFVYACGECGKPWGASLDGAKRCCLQEYCGCGKKKGSYMTLCGDCIGNKRLENSETITGYGGPLYQEETDTYFADMDEFLDMTDLEDQPKYLWACDLVQWKGPDSQDIVESELDEHHEDAYDSLIDIDGLDKFLKQWNKKQVLCSWHVDYKRKIAL